MRNEPDMFSGESMLAGSVRIFTDVSSCFASVSAPNMPL